MQSEYDIRQELKELKNTFTAYQRRLKEIRGNLSKKEAKKNSEYRKICKRMRILDKQIRRLTKSINQVIPQMAW